MFKSFVIDQNPILDTKSSLIKICRRSQLTMITQYSRNSLRYQSFESKMFSTCITRQFVNFELRTVVCKTYEIFLYFIQTLTQVLRAKNDNVSRRVKVFFSIVCIVSYHVVLFISLRKEGIQSDTWIDCCKKAACSF